ncbi:hypothetical protein, partial [Thioclava sp.]|uniref:hypothetical protein n=1 Tax=Thioclava sp. TaxID=1933450 RepID=UPI003AA998D6
EQRQLDMQPHVQPNLQIQGKGIRAKHEMCLFSDAYQEIGSGGRGRSIFANYVEIKRKNIRFRIDSGRVTPTLPLFVTLCKHRILSALRPDQVACEKL